MIGDISDDRLEKRIVRENVSAVWVTYLHSDIFPNFAGHCAVQMRVYFFHCANPFDVVLRADNNF